MPDTEKGYTNTLHFIRRPDRIARSLVHASLLLHSKTEMIPVINLTDMVH